MILCIEFFEDDLENILAKRDQNIGEINKKYDKLYTIRKDKKV
jgi:hypothetical protein